MRRLRRIGSVISGNGGNADNKLKRKSSSRPQQQRPLCCDAFTMLPNEVHASLSAYLTKNDLKALHCVNRTLFKTYVGLCWKEVEVHSVETMSLLTKLALLPVKKTMHDYFHHIQYIKIELWGMTDNGKVIAKFLERVASTESKLIRMVVINVGAVWGDEIQKALSMLPPHCQVSVGVATRRLIQLDTSRLTNLRSLHLKVDFGNVSWLVPISRSIETFVLQPDPHNKRQLKVRDFDLQRTFSNARFLRHVSLEWVAIQSDGSTSWLPPSVTDLTLKRCSFDVVCDEAYFGDEVPVAANVTRLTVQGGAVNDDGKEGQVFMQFPRLHTLSLFRSELDITHDKQPLKYSPVDSADMQNLQSLNFSGYSFMDILSVVSSSIDRLPASMLHILNVPCDRWCPSGDGRNEGFFDVLGQLPRLYRVYLDCRPLVYEDVPFPKQLQADMTELIWSKKLGSVELVFDYGNPEKFSQICYAGGVDLELEDIPHEPVLQNVKRAQAMLPHNSILVC